uniref:Uncharacterized protein LOC66598 homolog n=1 Tax=Tokudaia muenninki TaxID=742503 RepID=A0A0S3NUF2_9MURI|nr:uncharacterized protein LOC66598 homolog [Tokudaia muenninki]BBG62336.1 bifunctional apoptosis regulator [Tokudaia muenninki]
MLHIPVTVQDQ